MERLTNSDYGYVLFLRESDLTAKVYGWRKFTGLLDKYGSKIYNADYVYPESTPNKTFRVFKDDAGGRWIFSNGSYRGEITQSELKKWYVVKHMVFPMCRMGAKTMG